ncbi:MAG: amino acid ABC transporter substrate-binding protein [Labilithrix sp.]|nr:amino acid ABC transporter substrate-binding protein [Labilithrix sp.]MCW5815598.1 amino acid ABC transporter substrate-binding protein [Labilithrix sp.]
MKRIITLLFVGATLLGCDRSKEKAEADATPPIASTTAAAAPAPLTGDTPLFDLDTETQKAPDGSALDRIIKGLHVRVCVRADVAPFGSFSSTGLQGLEVELASALVEQISIDYKQPLKIDWTVVSAPERIKRLQEDGCDVLVASLSHTAERAGQVGLSKPYLKTDKVLLAAGKITRKVPVIAKVAGTTSELPADVKGTERVFTTYQEVAYAMDNEEIDYLVTDRPIADQLVRSVTKPYSVTKTVAPGAESYVAAVPNGHPELLAAVDKALADLARTGRLAHIHRRWL